MRTPDIPPAAIPLRTYSEVDHLATQFLLGKINLLVLVGRPGLSKSYCFSALVDQHRMISHYLSGKINPFPTYCDLYLHRHKLIVLDDAELLWVERAGRHLLRQLTDTGTKKELRWLSANRQMEKNRIPPHFETTSKVAIIANRFSFGNYSETEAILDRGCLFHFQPGPLEIHQKAATWFWDQTVFDFIGARLYHLKQLSLRTYRTAWELRQSQCDWRGFIESHYLDEAARFVQKMEANGLSSEERVRRFVDLNLGCRATYFNIRKRLDEAGQVHPAPVVPMRVQGKPPENVDIAAMVARAEAENAGDLEEDEESEKDGD
jgi:hypothetical protein